MEECSEVFTDNEEMILNGEFTGSLIKHISPVAVSAYNNCSDFAFHKIYRSKDVLDIELAGYRIIGFFT